MKGIFKDIKVPVINCNGTVWHPFPGLCSVAVLHHSCSKLHTCDSSWPLKGPVRAHYTSLHSLSICMACIVFSWKIPTPLKWLIVTSTNSLSLTKSFSAPVVPDLLLALLHKQMEIKAIYIVVCGNKKYTPKHHMVNFHLNVTAISLPFIEYFIRRVISL